MDYVWIVERKSGNDWYPMPMEVAYTRQQARFRAYSRRLTGFDVRVRKYARFT